MHISRGLRLALLMIMATVVLRIGPATALAQEQITLSSMSVALWPEYDRPGVLVIYSGALSADVRLPVDITFAIPASAGKPSATAGIDDQGNFRYRQYQAVPVGDRLMVSYNLPYRRFQLEYYYDPLEGQGSDRQFDYVYESDYTVDSFTLEVQEPKGSEGFATDPVADSQTVEMQLPLNLIPIGPLAAGETTGVAVSYHKQSEVLSAEAMGVPTPGTVEFEDAPRQKSGSQSVLIIAIIAAGVIAVAVGLVIWARAQKQKKSPRSRQARREAARKAGMKPGQGGKLTPARKSGGRDADESRVTGYCHICGRALKTDERFCPGCGTARKE